MKKMMYLMLVASTISFSAFIALTNWKVKEPYEVKFAGGKIHGEFEGGLKASIQFDKAHPEESKISATIDVSTLATGFFIKTAHAKEALDADQYPSISFLSTSVSKNGNDFDARGRLTMKGVTQPITIHFTFEDKGNEGVFKGSFKVIPKDFNITKKLSKND